MQILFPFPVIYKNRRGLPRRFPLFPSRAFLREFSFLALSRDIIPLDCVFFRGILFRLPHAALMQRHPPYLTSCPVMLYTFSPRRMTI